MKLFFISDIHGSYYFLNQAVEKYHEEGACNIIILGDALYHGPRNPLPKEYNPQAVAGLLNEYSKNIIAVRGNCDSEVDQMLINYPMMSDYSLIFQNSKRIFLTHGHIFSPENLPKLCVGDTFIYGHTHIPLLEKKNGINIINPGSISLPKEGNSNTYGILENNIFRIKDFTGKIIKETEL